MIRLYSFVAILLTEIMFSNIAKAQLGFTVVPTTGNHRERTVRAALPAPTVVTPAAVRGMGGLGAFAPPGPIPVNCQIKIVGESAGEYIFEVTHDSTGTVRVVGGAVQYYSAPIAVVDASTNTAQKVKPVIGAFSFPFKWRPQAGKFETGFSLGACGGVQLPLNRLSSDHNLMFLAGVGSSAVPVRVADVAAEMKLTETTNLGALTVSFTGMYIWKKPSSWHQYRL